MGLVGSPGIRCFNMVLGEKCSECKALYLRCLYVIVVDIHEALMCNDGVKYLNGPQRVLVGLRLMLFLWVDVF